jgi:pimeloyl-ACP methyl ester carboxylesterase
VLAGHSLGGVVALMLAARFPDRLKALILEDPAITLENYRKIVESSRDMFGIWLELKKRQDRSASAEAAADLWARTSRFRSCPGRMFRPSCPSVCEAR